MNKLSDYLDHVLSTILPPVFKLCLLVYLAIFVAMLTFALITLVKIAATSALG